MIIENMDKISPMKVGDSEWTIKKYNRTAEQEQQSVEICSNEFRVRQISIVLCIFPSIFSYTSTGTEKTENYI